MDRPVVKFSFGGFMVTFAEQLIGDYDKVQATFRSLLSEIVETLEGDVRTTAFRAAHDALSKNNSADTQMTALVDLRISIRKQA
jgi:hypothetical protein